MLYRSCYYEPVSLEYHIDPITLNLTNRQKWTNNGNTLEFNEDFTFDPLDRITQWEVTDSRGTSQVYSVNYANNGNITYKTDMGLYAYNSTKPNAVEYVHNLEGPEYAVADNRVGYNLFNKTSALLVEQSGKQIFNYAIEYGADDQRRKTTFIRKDEDPVTTIYAGLFEERSDGHRLYHIKTPAGISALIVTNRNDPGQRDIYYLYNDYQGSLIAAQLQGSSDLLEEFSYDPWGRRRNGDNWLSYDVPGTSFSKFYKRGYTGHEHLDDFKLINMNGRMYDPRLARFLSPDPFVQAPDFSQSYNRYSYVWNNPLKYTDPSGEFLVPALIITSIIGAYIGGSAAEGWEMNPLKWEWDKDTWAGIGLGALSGAAAGLGFYHAAPALASTGFFSHFGVSGTIAAYSITGAASLGAGGYLAGFSGGMLHSNGDWGYSHQSGIIGAQIGSSIGLVLGSFVGIIEGYESPKPAVLPNLLGQNEQSYSSTNNLGTPIPELSSELFLDAEFKGYYFGAKVYEHNIFSGGAGICLPPFGIGVGPGVYNSQSPYNRTLLAHEFGHWLQFHDWGSISYYLIVAPASLYFAQTRNKYGWTEIDANRRAYDFHQEPTWWHDWFPLQTP